MKKLAEYINNRYVSLKGLDTEVVEKLSNIDGLLISECCGCYPGCDCACDDCGDCGCGCEYDTCPEPCSGELGSSQDTAISTTYPTPVPTAPVDPITRVKEKFYTQPKVYDLMDAHTTLTYKCRFLDVIQDCIKEPLFFIDSYTTFNGYDRSKKLRDDILTICEEFGLLWPVLMIRNNGDIQLFAAKKFGSNGEECSIKSSLIEAANILTKLEKRKEIAWAQVLDVAIDNLDDLYDFLFTVTFVKDKYDEELESLREKDMKNALSIQAAPIATMN